MDRYVYFVNRYAKMDHKIERRKKSFNIFQFSVCCVLAAGEIEQGFLKKHGFRSGVNYTFRSLC